MKSDGTQVPQSEIREFTNKKLGIEDELKRQGVCEGDTVKILEWEFEWYE